MSVSDAFVLDTGYREGMHNDGLNTISKLILNSRRILRGDNADARISLVENFGNVSNV